MIIIYLLAFLSVLTILSGFLSWKFDLTEDHRFSLTTPTKEMLSGLDDLIYIKILLDGDYESNFKRLRKETEETLKNFQRYSSQVVYDIEDPLTGDLEIVRATQESLAKDFIFPFTVGSVAQSGRSELQLYPYALFYFGERMVPVNLLEEQTPGVPPGTFLWFDGPKDTPVCIAGTLMGLGLDTTQPGSGFSLGYVSETAMIGV